MTRHSNIQPNDRIAFDCEECGKNLQLTGSIYLEIYKDHTKCLGCRPPESTERLKLCEHGNYSCYTCEIKLLKYVITDLEAERDRYKAALGLAMSENQSPEIYKEVQKIIGADT